MIRPKFIVGEPVRVACVRDVHENTDRTEVTRLGYAFNRGTHLYQTASQTDPKKWFLEKSLRKIPPGDRLSWEDLRQQLVTENDNVEA